MNSWRITDLGLVLGVLGVSWLSLGITKRTKRVTRSIGWLLLVMALLNSYAEIRSPLFGTRFFGMLLAMFFEVAYSYLFVSLCSHLGIIGWGRAVRAALLPAAYAGPIAFVVVAYMTERLWSLPQALFALIEFGCAIHVALFASVMSDWHKRGYLPIANGSPNEDRRDLDWAILGLALTTANLIIGLIFFREDIELFALNLVLVGILAVPVILVRRGSRALRAREA